MNHEVHACDWAHRCVRRLAAAAAATVAVAPIAVWQVSWAAAFEVPIVTECTLPPLDPPAFSQEDVTYATVENGTVNLDLTLIQPDPGQFPGPRPLVVLLHGGAFVTGNRADLERPARQLASEGFAAITADYRLTDPTGSWYTFPSSVQDARCVVAWARQNAVGRGFDLERIAVVGLSAGGSLAAGVAVMDELVTFSPSPEVPPVPIDTYAVAFHGYQCGSPINVGDPSALDVNRALVLYGPADVTVPIAEWPPFTLAAIMNYLGASPALNPFLAAQASAVSYLGAGALATPTRVPMLLLHGDVDPIVPVAQSQLFAADLAAAGVSHGIWVTAGVGHSFAPFDSDYVRPLEEGEDPDALPTCVDDLPPGTVCAIRDHNGDPTGNVRVVDALLTSSCSGITFLRDMVERGFSDDFESGGTGAWSTSVP